MYSLLCREARIGFEYRTHRYAATVLLPVHDRRLLKIQRHWLLAVQEDCRLSRPQFHESNVSNACSAAEMIAPFPA